MLWIEVIEGREITLLHCRGSLLAGLATERFREIALSYSDRVLLIDASELEKIDAAGLGVCVEVHQKAVRSGGAVIIADPMPWVKECLRLTCVDLVLNLVTLTPSPGSTRRARLPHLGAAA